MILSARPLSWVLLLALLLMAIPTLTALGSREDRPERFTGTAAVKGSEPFTRIVLVTENEDLALTGPLADKIRQNFQGHRVTVKGKIEKEALGPGFPAELYVIEIIKTDP
jgi:hypothetical protein